MGVRFKQGHGYQTLKHAFHFNIVITAVEGCDITSRKIFKFFAEMLHFGEFSRALNKILMLPATTIR